MSRFSVRRVAAVVCGGLLLSGVVVSCSSGSPDGGGEVSGLVAESERGYRIAWPEEAEINSGASGVSPEATEVYTVLLDGDPLVRGLVVVEEASEPYEESQFFFRRELQPTINAFNLTWRGEISATNQGVLSVPVGGSSPGLFVNVAGDIESGFAAVVPLADGQLLKVVLASIPSGDPEVEELIGRLVTELEVL